MITRYAYSSTLPRLALLLALLLPGAFRAAQAQNVGIGTTLPTQKLDVDGSLRVRGLTTPGLVRTDANGNFSAADVTFPAAGPDTGNPAPAGTATGLDNPLVAVSGSLAVVLNRGTGTLSLYDVSNPASLVLRGTYSGISSGMEVAMSGSTAAVLTNVTNSPGSIGNVLVFTLGAGAPTLATTLVPAAALSGVNGGIALDGSRLYAIYDRGGGFGYFYAYDVSVPTAPTLLGSYTATGPCFTPQTVTASGNFVAVGNMYGGVAVLNVSNPAAITLAGSVGCAGYTGADRPVALRGSALVTLDIPANQLLTYTLSATGVPTLRSTYTTGTNPVSVALDGNAAYVASRGTNTLQVVDVSGTTAVLRGTATLSSATNNVALNATTSPGSTLVLAANGSPTNNLQAFTINGPRSVTVAPNGSLSTTPLPTPADYVQNTPVSTQTGSFNLSGNGLLGGNLGLGTTAPVTRLEVARVGSALPATTGTAQTAGHYARFTNGSTLALDLGGNGTSGSWLQSTSPTSLSTNYPLLLNPNGGNIGINTTMPVRSLDIGSLTSPRPALVRLGAGNGGAARQWELGVQANTSNLNDISGEFYDFTVRDVTGGNTRLLIEYNTGNVGIGTPAPASTLDVAGYTRLAGPAAPTGGTVPSVAVAAFTGTLPTGPSAVSSVALGISATRILSVSVLATINGDLYPPNHSTDPALTYGYHLSGTNLVLSTGPNATGVSAQPVKVLVTYQP